jgi:hypothetical protein
MKLNVTELARGAWQACIEGEEATAFMDRAPDQALAGLIRANLSRFGISAIVYGSTPENDPNVLPAQRRKEAP